jgi:U-box domain
MTTSPTRFGFRIRQLIKWRLIGLFSLLPFAYLYIRPSTFKMTTSSVVRTVIPEGFLCPITHEIMREPLMCRSGLSFERAAIISWLYDHNNACPITRERLSPRDLVSNNALRVKILAWREENGLEISDDGFDDTEKATEGILCTCLASSLTARATTTTKERSASPSNSPSIIRFMLSRKFRPDQ